MIRQMAADHEKELHELQDNLQKERNERIEHQNKALEYFEELQLMRRRLFGRSAERLSEEERKQLWLFNEAELIIASEQKVEKEEEGPPTGPPINIEISGEDIHMLGELAAKVRKEIKDIPGLVDLKDNFVKGKPEVRVRVDKEKAALLGLDTYTIAYTVKAAINGVKAGVYREGKDEYDIIARLPKRDRSSIESLKRITVSGPMGDPIPLTSLAQVSLGSGIGAIMRLDQSGWSPYPAMPPAAWPTTSSKTSINGCGKIFNGPEATPSVLPVSRKNRPKPSPFSVKPFSLVLPLF